MVGRSVCWLLLCCWTIMHACQMECVLLLRHVPTPWREGQPGLRLRGGYRESEVVKEYILIMSKPKHNVDGERREQIILADYITNTSNERITSDAVGDDSDRQSGNPPDQSSHQELDESARYRLATEIHEVAMQLYQEMNRTGAEKLLKAAIEFCPQHIAANADYACLIHRLYREYEKAESIYERILDWEPGNVQCLCNCAWLHYAVYRDADKAESYLKLAHASEPNHPDVLHMLARVLSEGKEQHDEAEKLYKKGLEIAPDYFELLYSYGSFCMDFRGSTFPS
mmetsp:Transcript_43507/g.137611  ORF Transcript_43507/g.137611 Transcript_43507/m.137611 type:complete len:284 (-) Transcript_43507:840-1691(-)